MSIYTCVYGRPQIYRRVGNVNKSITINFVKNKNKIKRKESDVPVAHLILHFCNFLLIDDITLCQLIFLYDDPQLLCLRFVC